MDPRAIAIKTMKTVQAINARLARIEAALSLDTPTDAEIAEAAQIDPTAPASAFVPTNKQPARRR